MYQPKLPRSKHKNHGWLAKVRDRCKWTKGVQLFIQMKSYLGGNFSLIRHCRTPRDRPCLEFTRKERAESLPSPGVVAWLMMCGLLSLRAYNEGVIWYRSPLIFGVSPLTSWARWNRLVPGPPRSRSELARLGVYFAPCFL